MKSWPDLTEEELLWEQGYRGVAGLDEVGRGAWAGPVMAAAVILPPDAAVASRLTGLNDSKQLTPAQREHLFPLIQEVALALAVGQVPASEIDRLGIVAATRLAMVEALTHLPIAPDFLLVDALTLPAVALPQKGIIRGDGRCLSIAAASVVAKVTRDRWMDELDRRCPGYDFGRHKGYGTPGHQAALARLGVSVWHRCSYAPVRRMMSRANDE